MHLLENLSGDEMPPEWMWPLPWELDAALERVVEARKSKRGSSDSNDPTDVPPPAPGTANTLYAKQMAQIDAAQPVSTDAPLRVSLPDVIPAKS